MTPHESFVAALRDQWAQQAQFVRVRFIPKAPICIRLTLERWDSKNPNPKLRDFVWEAQDLNLEYVVGQKVCVVTNPEGVQTLQELERAGQLSILLPPAKKPDPGKRRR